MYFVYKITNLINQKSYIGSSTISRGYNTRWEEHIKSARNVLNPCYNYPLQKAIRKYGIENFSYQILVDNIQSFSEREQIEKEKILEYNTLTNSGYGYNQTVETRCALCDPVIKEQQLKKVSKQCCLVDSKNNVLQVFESVHEASRFIHCEDGPSVITKVCDGKQKAVKGFLFRWIDENNNVIIPSIQPRKLKRAVVAISCRTKEKKYFDSVLEASKILHLDRKSIHCCLRGDQRYSQVGEYVFREIDENKNIIENAINIKDVFSKYITINGETHIQKEWCDILQISLPTLNRRMKNHKETKEQAFQYYFNKKRG